MTFNDVHLKNEMVYVVTELSLPIAEGDFLLPSSLYIAQRLKATESIDRSGGSHKTCGFWISQNDRRSCAHVHA